MKPAVWFSYLLASAFLLLATRTLFDPEGAAVRFGLPLMAGADGAFVQVYATRNLVIALALLTFVLRREWRAARVVLTLATLLPLCDLAILVTHGGRAVAFHLIALVLLATDTWLVGRAVTRSDTTVALAAAKPAKP